MSHRLFIRRAPAVAASLMTIVALGARLAQGAEEQTAEERTAAPRAQFTAGEGAVFVIPIEGEIEKGLYMVLNRALRQARGAGARAIILDMDTFGGEVAAATKIRDRLIETSIPTLTYINPRAISAGAFISIATDQIVMGPASNIGGALPITIGPGGANPVDAKMLSIFKSEMTKTARYNGYPVDIVAGFCDPDVEIPGLKEKGEILTLDYDQATSVGLASYTSPSLEAMLEREGFGSAEIIRFQPTPTDAVARFLSSPVVMGILMLIGMGGLFFEVKSPGFGVPGIIGLAALATYFFGAYLAHLSGYMELIFFIVGVILLTVEIFVLPGFGVFGIAGLVLIAGSLFFALVGPVPEGFGAGLQDYSVAIYTMTTTMFTAVPMVWMISRLFPRTALYGAVMLAAPAGGPGSPASATAQDTAEPPAPLQPGERGVALTDLRPSGKARFGQRRADVVTEGDFLDRDTAIRVLRIEGSRIFVRAEKS